MSSYEERYNELLREFEQIEAINNNFIRKFEKKEEEMKELRDICEELNADIGEKDATINKAAKVIDTLRLELEKAKNDIEGLEGENSRLAREKKEKEKELAELQRSLQNVDILMKSETRAKQKTEKFKQELEIRANDFEHKERELLNSFKELQSENKKLEIRLDEVTSENAQLREQYKEKDIAFCRAVEKIAELEESVQKLLSDNRELAIEIVNKEKDYKRELEIVKKEAENQLRFYQNTKLSNLSTAKILQDKENLDTYPQKDTSGYVDRSPFRENRNITAKDSRTTNTQKLTGINKMLSKKNQSTKKKYPQRTSPPRREKESAEADTSVLEDADNKVAPGSAEALNNEMLKIHMHESIDQTNRLIEGIDNYLNKEAKHVNKLVKTVFEREVALRPEVERWIMRNEEMEQRLFEYAQKARIMTILVADCQSAVRIYADQKEAEKKLKELLEKEYEAAVEYLKMEIRDKDNHIKNLIARAESSAFETMNNDMQKIEMLQMNLNTLQNNHNELKGEQTDLARRHEDLQFKHEDLFSNYVQLRDNFMHLEDILGFNFNEREGAMTNEDSLTIDEVPFPIGIEAMSQRIKTLQNVEQEFHKQRREFEEEREKLFTGIVGAENQIKDLEEERRASENEKREIYEQIQSFEESFKEMSRNLDEANDRVRQLDVENEVLKGEIERVNEISDSYYHKIEDLNQHLDNLRKELDKMEQLADSRGETIKTLEKMLQDLEEKHQETSHNLKDEIMLLKQRIVRVEEESKQYSQREQELEHRNAELKDEKTRIVSLIEQALVDYETAQKKLKSYEARIDNLEKENSILTNDNFELRKEIRDVLDQETQVVETKTKAIRALEQQLFHLGTERDSLKDELSRFKIEARTNKSVLSAQEKSPERYETGERSRWKPEYDDHRRNSEIDRSSYARNLSGIKRALIRLESELESRTPDVFSFREPERSRQTDIHREGIDDPDILRLIESITVLSLANRQALQKKIRDYEVLLGYLENNFVKLCDNNYAFYEERQSFESEVEEAGTRTQNVKDLQAMFKSMLQDISLKLENQLQLEVQHIRRVLEVIDERCNISEDDRENLRAFSKQLIDLSFKKSKKEMNDKIGYGRDFIVDLLERQRKSSQSDNYASRQGTRERRKSPDSFERKTRSILELSANLNTLAAEMIERSGPLKSIGEKYYKVRDEYKRDVDSQKLLNESLNKLFEKAIVNSYTGLMSLAEILYDSSHRIKSILTDKDADGDSALKNLKKLTQVHWEKEDKFLSGAKESILNLEKKLASREVERGSFPQSTRNASRSEEKASTVIRDFFEELQDIMDVTKNYTSGLENKSLKNPSLSTIVEDSGIIYSVLRDNLSGSDRGFIKYLQKELDDYYRDQGADHPTAAKEHFYNRFKSIFVEKLQEEVLNIRNAFKLLDLNLSAKNLVRNDGKEEPLKSKLKENNDRLAQVVTIGQTILNYSELFNVSDKEQEIDPQTFYDTIFRAYQEDPTLTRTSRKDRIHLQVCEMLREIGGFKIAFNSLIYLCARYRKIIGEIRP